LHVDDGIRDLGVALMRPWATIIGAVDTTGLEGERIFAQVEGIQRVVETDSAGRYIISDIPEGTYSVRTITRDQQTLQTGQVEALSTDTAVVTAMLPSPWVQIGINETPAGGATFANGTFLVAGGGPDIWDTADGFHFVYQERSGNFQITARVASHEDSIIYAKSGVMIRESLDPSAPAVTLCLETSSPEWQVPIASMLVRSASGDSTFPLNDTNYREISAPYWLRLSRQGDVFTGFVSADGVVWELLASDTVAMGGSVYAGLAVTSHEINRFNTATFEAVSVE
jgi:regulation of enolase protein 1 (concanavalin A-like superfamily)